MPAMVNRDFSSVVFDISGTLGSENAGLDVVSPPFSFLVSYIGAKKDIELISAEAARLGMSRQGAAPVLPLPRTFWQSFPYHPSLPAGVNTVAVESLREVYTEAAEDNPGADYVSVYNTINPPQPPQQ
jgi:hypothetical protein